MMLPLLRSSNELQCSRAAHCYCAVQSEMTHALLRLNSTGNYWTVRCTCRYAQWDVNPFTYLLTVIKEIDLFSWILLFFSVHSPWQWICVARMISGSLWAPTHSLIVYALDLLKCMDKCRIFPFSRKVCL